MTNESVSINGTEFITRDDVMKKFNISSVTLWKWTRNGTLRHHRLGKRVYFLESEICEDIRNSGGSVRKSHKEAI